MRNESDLGEKKQIHKSKLRNSVQKIDLWSSIKGKINKCWFVSLFFSILHARLHNSQQVCQHRITGQQLSKYPPADTSKNNNISHFSILRIFLWKSKSCNQSVADVSVQHGSSALDLFTNIPEINTLTELATLYGVNICVSVVSPLLLLLFVSLTFSPTYNKQCGMFIWPIWSSSQWERSSGGWFERYEWAASSISRCTLLITV